MKFVDSINELKLHSWCDYFKKKGAIKAIDEVIKQHVDTVDMLRCFIADVEQQISVWEEEQAKNPKANFHDEIELFNVIADFFRLNGRLILIELDINTARKYLVNSKTEYEYRFFARRIYTLLYEAKKGLADKVSNLFPKLQSIVDAKNFGVYEREKKNLHAFLNKHQTELMDVRNKNEAHKTEAFESQVESIENMSVVKSFMIIQEGGVHLYNLNCAFMVVQQALMTYLGKMAVEKIKGIRGE